MYVVLAVRLAVGIFKSYTKKNVLGRIVLFPYSYSYQYCISMHVFWHWSDVKMLVNLVPEAEAFPTMTKKTTRDAPFLWLVLRQRDRLLFRPLPVSLREISWLPLRLPSRPSSDMDTELNCEILPVSFFSSSSYSSSSSSSFSSSSSSSSSFASLYEFAAPRRSPNLLHRVVATALVVWRKRCQLRRADEERRTSPNQWCKTFPTQSPSPDQ